MTRPPAAKKFEKEEVINKLIAKTVDCQIRSNT
jgi:hypothetical protein